MNKLFLFLIIFNIWVSSLAQKPAFYDENLKSMYKNTVELITTEELSKQLAEDTGLVLLDSRELKEYMVSHISGARHVGFETFDLEIVEDLSRETPIVVYCSLGLRSEMIGEKLVERGFSNVKNLSGGIFEWVYSEKQIVNDKGQVTDEVHTYDKNWSSWLLKGKQVY